MRVKTAKKLFILFFCLCLLFLSGCGDMEVILPGSGTYQIRALSNDVLLETNSLVWAGDQLRPYCDSLLSKDPDVSGLLVLIQNAQKETVGGRVYYTLRDELPAAFEVEVKEENNDEETEYESGGEGEGAGTAEESEPSRAAAESFASNENFDIKDTIFRVKSLDAQLPVFTLPEGLEVGLYTLVFKVLGDRETFSETEQNFFYLGNARFTLKDLNLYLPGVYAESWLIRPGTKVLLEAVIETERNINPYIIWYNGKKIIEEGFVSDGAGMIFFEAPDQNALQTLRVEVFPARARQGMNGVSREIILPVSTNAGEPDFFSGTPLANFSQMMTETKQRAADDTIESDEPYELSEPELMRWYQFAGTLDDENDSLDGRNRLVSVLDRQPRFSPMNHTYGLSTGHYEAYNVPEISFSPNNEKNGGGAFLFRIKPVASGDILNVVFDTSPAVPPVSMHLVVEEENIILRLTAGENVTSEMAISVGKEEKGAQVTAAIVFYLLPDRLEAKLVPEEKSPDQVKAIYVRLREPLDGKCSVSLGSQNASAREQGRQRNYSRRNIPASAIWNELAIFYLSPPDFDLLEPEETNETEISKVGIKDKLSNNPENG